MRPTLLGIALAPSSRPAARPPRAAALLSGTTELEQGVEPAEFESFVAGPFVEAWKDEIAGLGRAVLKGDRGVNVGGYRIVYRFRPYTLRDRYVPEPSTLSEEYRSEVMPLLPAEVDAQMMELASSAGFSDWTLIHR